MTTAVSTLNASLLAKINAKRKEIQARTNRVDVIRPQAGKAKYRILPAHPGKPEGTPWWADFGRHYIKDVDGKMSSVYVCVEQTFGKPCAVCQEIARASKHATDDAELKALEDARCKSAQILVNVLARSDAEKATTPQVLALSPTTFEKVLGLISEYGDITDLNDGVDIIIERTGSGMSTRYGVMPAAKSQPVPASVMEQAIDLEEYVAQESEADLRKAINAVNAIVGILDYATESAPKAALTAPKAALAAAATIDDAELGELIDEDEFATLPAKKTGTDDAPFVTVDAVSTTEKAAAPAAGGDMDIDALLSELDDM